MPVAIDTLKFSKRLQAAGMASAQADVFAEAVGEALSEVQAANEEIAELRVATKQFAERRRAIQQNNAELRAAFAELRAEMRAVGTRLICSMGVGFAATVAILGALIVAHR